MANAILPKFLKFVSLFCKEFNNMEMINQYDGISLTMFSEDDDIIPVKLIKKIADRSTYPCKITGTHNNPNIDWNNIGIFIKY